MKIKLLRGVIVEAKPTAAGTVLETVNGPWARSLIARGWAEEVADTVEAEGNTEGNDVPKVIIDTGKDDDETEAKPKGNAKPKAK